MLKRGQAQRIVDEVRTVVADWPRYAADAGVDGEHVRRITPNLRLNLPADRAALGLTP